MSIFRVASSNTLAITNIHNISSFSPTINILYENAHYIALIPIADINKIRQFIHENYALRPKGWPARF